MTNLKLAFRRLLKTPFVTAVAIVSLALGIGANAAIFSLFDQTLLRAIPVPRPDELVNLAAPGPKPGSTSCNQAGACTDVFSYPMFRDLEKAQQVFTGLAAHVSFEANLAIRSETMNSELMLVSGSYFPVLGLRPEIGRLLDERDDQTIGGHFVAVLSHGFWTSHLGASPSVLNETIIVNGQSMTIVGVAPRGFKGTVLGSDPAVFVPVTMRAQVVPGRKDFDNRRGYWAYLFGRLKPGVTLDQARAQLGGQYTSIINTVEAPLQKGMSEQTMQRFRAKVLEITEGRRGQSSVHTEARIPMLLLLTVTGIVLLIACANIANLLLARAAGRSTEMAVRLSIGASRWQLLRQLLMESCLLAVLGGVAGLLVSRWTLAYIATLLPPEAATIIDFHLQTRVVLFAGVVALATGVLFGIFPALHSTRADLVTTLKAQAGQPSGARGAAWFRRILVTSQITLSMALLICAGLFVKSLAKISHVDLGIKVDHVVTFAISPSLSGYDTERSRTFYKRLEEEFAGAPGVTGVGAAMVPLLAGSSWGNDVSVEGFEKGPDTDAGSRVNVVSPGYFRTLGVPLMAGRDFTAADGKEAPKVAIVNEAFANKFNLGRNAVEKHMGTGSDQKLEIEIVGVVQNAKYSDVKQQVPPLFFRPYPQAERVDGMSFYVRTATDPEAFVRTIAVIVARLDPTLPVEDAKTMTQQVRDNVFLDRMISTLAAAFALLATILASVGLYGVLAYTVTQRTREIGLRMALGANGSRVRRLVLSQVAWMTVVGAAFGIAVAYWLGRLAKSQLFEMEGFDPAVFAGASVALVFVAFLAGIIPAYRASRVDPMTALRYE